MKTIKDFDPAPDGGLVIENTELADLLRDAERFRRIERERIDVDRQLVGDAEDDKFHWKVWPFFGEPIVGSDLRAAIDALPAPESKCP